MREFSIFETKQLVDNFDKIFFVQRVFITFVHMGN